MLMAVKTTNNLKFTSRSLSPSSRVEPYPFKQLNSSEMNFLNTESNLSRLPTL